MLEIATVCQNSVGNLQCHSENCNWLPCVFFNQRHYWRAPDIWTSN